MSRTTCVAIAPPPWMQGRCQNELAKPEFAMYTSGRQTGLIPTRLTWRHRGALPLRQAHYIVRAAEGDGPEAPAERKSRLLEQLRQDGTSGTSTGWVR